MNMIVPVDAYDPRIWWIDVGPFFDRFGPLKYAILSSADLSVRALILDCTVRHYIDLTQADLSAGLDMLIAKGFAIDKAQILAAHTTEDERHIKGLREIWA